jgi:hypothetical protein
VREDTDSVENPGRLTQVRGPVPLFGGIEPFERSETARKTLRGSIDALAMSENRTWTY